VMIPRVGESKPSRCLFFSKNSAMLMLRCCFASSSASVRPPHPVDGFGERHLPLLSCP
jgi:hypothetical protein